MKEHIVHHALQVNVFNKDPISGYCKVETKGQKEI